MSDNTISKLLRDLRVNAVPHGSDPASATGAGRADNRGELAEAALAHTIRNKAEAAYARTDLLERRRKLMEAWAQ